MTSGRVGQGGTALDIPSVESVGIPLGSIKSGNLRHFLRNCKDRGKEETVFHLLCECPELAVRRRTFLGRHMFFDLGELSESRIGDLLKYFTATGWI
ncbi:hypothetical protein EVAR_73886_1 [Eumeta japonica]|uniref:Uncharacterized protein n=1 Tax=Eumeta variegata TaxID=151549 RepID=A0A4C1SZE4_EUMVA|nr:hypothetical protein EVAR_73886_1 [Eumeta japonica]